MAESKYVEWIEPFMDDEFGSMIGPVYLRLSVENAIAARKALVAPTDFRYVNDEQALADFVTAHWGRIVDEG